MTPAPQPPPRKIGIRNGWRWFTGALGMLRRWPATFLTMGFIAGVIYTLFPYLGRLVLLIVGPAFLAGIAVAAHTGAGGGRPAIRQLFAMFEHRAQRAEALKLCIPLVLANVIAALMLAVALTNVMASQGIDIVALEGHTKQLMAAFRSAAVSAPMRPWWIVAFGMLAFAWTFTALAIPQVALSKSPAWRAMGRSFRQVWGHLAAWIVAVVAVLVCVAIVGAVLQLTRLAVIVQLGAFTTTYALLGPMLYLAWRDLGGIPAAPDRGPPASSQPPAPPPPSGFLEA